MIHLDGDILQDLEKALKREWLETNGLGGFASSTVAGLNARRYHGLLVAATRPPVGRTVMLSKLEESVYIGKRRIDLSANEYPGVIHPQGHLHLKRFRLDPFPIFTYEVEGFEIDKTVFMIHGENTTAIRYEVRRISGQATDILLEVRPLIAVRDYHGATHENSAISRETSYETGLASFAAYEGAPTLHIAHDADEVEQAAFWFRNFLYRVERERGLDSQEDLFSPFALRFALRFDVTIRSGASIIASLEKRDARRIGEYSRLNPRVEPGLAQLLRMTMNSCANSPRRRTSSSLDGIAAPPLLPAITGSAIGAATP